MSINLETSRKERGCIDSIAAASIAVPGVSVVMVSAPASLSRASELLKEEHCGAACVSLAQKGDWGRYLALISESTTPSVTLASSPPRAGPHHTAFTSPAYLLLEKLFSKKWPVHDDTTHRNKYLCR